MKEEIEQALGVAKELAKAMLEDQELMKITAELSKQYLDMYIAAGFTRKEALKLVAATAGKK